MKEAVIQAILKHDPNEVVDGAAVDRLALYFERTDYKPEDLDEMSANVFFAYDVLKMSK